MADAYNGLGASVEMTHSRLDIATEHFENAVKLNRNNEPAFFSLVHILGRTCDWRQHDVRFSVCVFGCMVVGVCCCHAR